MSRDYTVHPLAALFSGMSEKEFEKFKQDIQKNGQQVPLMLSERWQVVAGWPESGPRL